MDDASIAFAIFMFLIARGLFYVLWEIDAIERARVLKVRLLYRMYHS